MLADTSWHYKPLAAEEALGLWDGRSKCRDLPLSFIARRTAHSAAQAKTPPVLGPLMKLSILFILAQKHWASPTSVPVSEYLHLWPMSKT